MYIYTYTVYMYCIAGKFGEFTLFQKKFGELIDQPKDY